MRARTTRRRGNAKHRATLGAAPLQKAATTTRKKPQKSTEPTEIEASVFADELQRVHQLPPTQRLRRGDLLNVERQCQREEQRATGRGHVLDLRGEKNKNTFAE